MSIKAKSPNEDPETKARREAAEARAAAGRIDSTQDNLSVDTRSVLRRFGRLSVFAGQPSLVNPQIASPILARAGGGKGVQRGSARLAALRGQF